MDFLLSKGEEIPVYRYMGSLSFQTEPVTLEELQASKPTVTRRQFVETLYARFGSGAGTAAHAFTDVPAENRAIAWAVSQSVVSGSHGKFMPEQAITREQAAVMLENYAKTQGAGTAESAELQKALDYDAIASWARPAAAFCQSNGTIMVGADGKYRPQDPLSPVEVQIMLSTFAAKLG